MRWGIGDRVGEAGLLPGADDEAWAPAIQKSLALRREHLAYPWLATAGF